MKAYSNLEMREADCAAIESGTPAHVLMERAGKALAKVVESAIKAHGGDVLFVCGGGNNGGDGFVAAEILRAKGEEVHVVCMAEHFSPECARAKQNFKGEIMQRIPRRLYAIAVDCLFGTGLSRAPEGINAALIGLIQSARYVVSADIPSGLSENGFAFSPCVQANETVCMGLLKRCLVMGDGVDVSGKITVADIGIAPVSSGTDVIEQSDILPLFPKRKSNVNKGTFRSACILAAYAPYTGAPFLSAAACLKSGAGYTKLYLPACVYPYAIGKLPACILKPFVSLDEQILSCECIAYGMGAGTGEEVYTLLKELLTRYQGTLVLDADALNVLACYGVDLLKKRSCQIVLTPHPKEFARLVDKSVDEVLKNGVALSLAFAEEYGAVVVLKGNRSIITDGKSVSVNSTGSPALAKGGSGDVLTGFLAGTVARGVAPYEAAKASCFVLGKAGELAAREMGEYSPDATDIVKYLAFAIRDLTVNEKKPPKRSIMSDINR